MLGLTACKFDYIEIGCTCRDIFSIQSNRLAFYLLRSGANFVMSAPNSSAISW